MKCVFHCRRFTIHASSSASAASIQIAVPSCGCVIA